eukprot:COSAG04_NODE_551_length_12696_cov_13.088989_15_plen_70_part_00
MPTTVCKGIQQCFCLDSRCALPCDGEPPAPPPPPPLLLVLVLMPVLLLLLLLAFLLRFSALSLLVLLLR